MISNGIYGKAVLLISSMFVAESVCSHTNLRESLTLGVGGDLLRLAYMHFFCIWLLVLL